MPIFIKNISAACFILLTLVQPFSRSLLVVSFNLNQPYIAANLCKNRFAEENNCHGKCCLQEKLDLVNETEDGQNPRMNRAMSESLFVRGPLPEELCAPLYPEISDYSIYRSDFSGSTLPDEIFHPPESTRITG